MGQNENRALLHEPIESLLNHRFILSINGRQCFIKHEDWRVSQQRPRNGYTLPLSATQLDALLPDQRLISIGQRFNKIVNIGEFGSIHNILMGRIGASHEDIVLDTTMKQIRVLRHHSDLPPDRIKTQRLQLLTAEQNLPLIWIVKTQ